MRRTGFLLLIFMISMVTLSAEVYSATGFPINTSTSINADVVITDIDSDGIAELIMGNNNGNLYVWTTKLKDITPPVTTDNTDALWHNHDVFVRLAASDDISELV